MKLVKPLNVIYQSAENGLADTIKPWLEQAGADCEKISVIDEKIKLLSMIDEQLEQAVIKTAAKLLILDSIQAYLGGGMDNEQCERILHQRQEIKRHTGEWVQLIFLKSQEAFFLSAEWRKVFNGWGIMRLPLMKS